MPHYSERSRSRLDSCTAALRRVFDVVIRHYDNTILEGHRSPERQAQLLAENKTKVAWSKHNESPSEAVDSSPYPIPEKWGDIPIPGELTPEQRDAIGRRIKTLAQFYHFAGFVQGVARAQGRALRWGGDWDGDRVFTDQSFDDLVHFETDDEGG